MHFRILKMIATSGFLTALECTKFVFGRSSALDRAGGAYSTSHPLAGLVRLLRRRGSKGRDRDGREGRKEKEGKG